MVAVGSEDLDTGLDLLLNAAVRCRRLPDTYRRIELWGYAAVIGVEHRHRLPMAHEWAPRLQLEASALGMRPLVDAAEHAPRSKKGHPRPAH